MYHSNIYKYSTLANVFCLVHALNSFHKYSSCPYPSIAYPYLNTHYSLWHQHYTHCMTGVKGKYSTGNNTISNWLTFQWLWVRLLTPWHVFINISKIKIPGSIQLTLHKCAMTLDPNASWPHVILRFSVGRHFTNTATTTTASVTLSLVNWQFKLYTYSTTYITYMATLSRTVVSLSVNSFHWYYSHCKLQVDLIAIKVLRVLCEILYTLFSILSTFPPLCMLECRMTI